MSFDFSNIFPDHCSGETVLRFRIRLLQFSHGCISELMKKEPEADDVLALYQVVFETIRSVAVDRPEQMAMADLVDMIALFELAIDTARASCPEPSAERPWEPIITQAAVNFRRMAEVLS